MDEIQTGKKSDVLNWLTADQKPVIPVDFAQWTMIECASQCLMDWIRKTAPPSVENLFRAYEFFSLYEKESLHNNGLVSGDMNSSAAETLVSGLQAMHDLGFRY